ncbi:class II glutamine amidotransferase [Vibrio sp. SS-MA-C1-2]|uniref:class II glutamine amidotransferase n=1 Tax=Vibrio sp. SS-MA-C1-2 TaxID=2908646 RepID=UPI001F3CDE7A|nr:class II glutamine amidotransferase [Vibrio sp. SS-MA-C1-2]UJF18404.1 class II glutamine amidotransferase [Vibrio sp. SS-MA-C1-2]
MCELLGLSSNKPTTMNRSFSSLAERGGNSGPHRDGWGVTFYDSVKGCRNFKDTNPSCCSEISAFVQQHRIVSPLIIAHIRQANCGEVRSENTHPFTRELWGECWTFAHNGQLNATLKLNTGDFTPMGETDSELAFCWLLDQIKTHFITRPESAFDLYEFIAEKARYLNQHGVFNMLLTDGRYLMAFCGSKLAWVKREAPFGMVNYSEGKGEHDLAQLYQDGDQVNLIATEPLTDENWQRMSPNEYALFKEGRCMSCEFN